LALPKILVKFSTDPRIIVFLGFVLFKDKMLSALSNIVPVDSGYACNIRSVNLPLPPPISRKEKFCLVKVLSIKS